MADADTIPLQEPTELCQGDTWRWYKDLPHHTPDDSWTLTYTLVNADDLYTFAASDAGDGRHLVTVAKATTANYTVAEYPLGLIGYVDDGTTRVTVYRGSLTVLSGPTAATDQRRHIKKVLDALQSVLESRATHDQLAISIRGRSISRMTADELVDWYGKYKAMYKLELMTEAENNGRPMKNKVLVRF
jgi:hypothetical protein